MTDRTKFYATAASVGEWDDAAAAARGFNRVVDAIVDAAEAGDDGMTVLDDGIHAAVHAAWDIVGSDELLPTMTAARAREIAARVY